MPGTFTPTHPSGEDHALPGSPDRESFSDLIGPMLAGAQARGVADTLELLGIGAALIDATGRVLHMGGRGRRVSGGWLRTVEHHLVADQPADNRALQTLIGTAIAEASETAAEVRLGQGQGGVALEIRALRFPVSNDRDQLLRAILVFEKVATV